MRIEAPAFVPPCLPQQTDEALASAVTVYLRTGHLDADLFSRAGPSATARALSHLSARERGQIEGDLHRADLGYSLSGLVGGVSNAVTSAANILADPVVQTPKERQAQAIQSDVENRWWADMQGQAAVDAALAPYRKTDRPVAALASSAEVQDVRENRS